MTSKYVGYSLTKLFAEIGDKEKAMSIYGALHPEMSREEIQTDFSREDEYRKYSAFELLTIVGRFSGGYDANDAIEHYMEMHPEDNEAEVRAELEAALTAARKKRPID